MFTNNINVYVYIDGNNLHRSVKELGWKMDYVKFFEFLQKKYNAHKAYIFIGYLEKHKALYQDLEDIGYEIMFKEVVETKEVMKMQTIVKSVKSVDITCKIKTIYKLDSQNRVKGQEAYEAIRNYFDPDVVLRPSVKGNCDGDMVLQIVKDMYEQGKNYKAVIVSADGDFASTIKLLQERQSLEMVLSPCKENHLSIFIKKLNVPIDYVYRHKKWFEKIDNSI